MSELKKPIENSLESLSMTIPFSCRDWGQEKRDAWVYGIVCGWDDDCRAGFEKKFGWNAETFDRLKRLHAHFEEVRRAQPENEPLTLDELREELERLEELATATNGDVEETYTNGYRWGHRNGQIELLRRILNIGDGTCESKCSKPERSEG